MWVQSESLAAEMAPAADIAEEGGVICAEIQALDWLPTAIVGLDAQGRFLYLNQAALALFGYTAEELAGKTLSTLVPPVLRQGVRAEFSRIVEKLDDREPTAANWNCQHKDGSALFLNVQSARSHLDSFSVIATVHRCRSEQEASNVSQGRDAILQQFFEALPVAVLVVKPGGIPVYANKKVIEFAGRGVDESIANLTLAEQFNACVAGTDIPYPHQNGPWAKALAGDSCLVDNVEVRRPDGKVRLELMTSPVFNENGEVVYAIGAMTDITERLKALEELSDLNRQLVVASREAGMADVASSILHNVGNILNSINVSVEQARLHIEDASLASLSRLADLLKEHQLNFSAFVNNDPRGQKLPEFLAALCAQLLTAKQAVIGEFTSLITNLDHVKQIVSTQQKYAVSGGIQELVPLVEIVNAAIALDANFFQQNNIDLLTKYDPAPPVKVDRHKVLMILVNLLRNACDAVLSNENGGRQVRVTIGAADGHIEVSVSDNGTGISPEVMPTLFRFGVTTKKNGHGFGLHSSANAAAECGGKLEAHSKGAGRGATFTLTLPVGDDAGGES